MAKYDFNMTTTGFYGSLLNRELEPCPCYIGMGNILRDVLKEAFDEKKILDNWTSEDVIKDYLYKAFMHGEIHADDETLDIIRDRINDRIAEKKKEVEELLRKEGLA